MWAKWDLHVHTPASIVQHYGDGQQDTTWEKYISDLESLSPNIRVIGINDYFLLDGYRRILKAKQEGRLQNIDLILPVVELRISSFAGHKELKKINYHVIFSDQISADVIETFFLRSFGMDITLDDGNPWIGQVCHREGLAEFGKAIKDSTPENKRPVESDLVVGFNHAAFSLEKIRDSLRQTCFSDKVVTAVGLAEWDSMRWDGGSSAIKKDIIQSADLVFTASHTPSNYHDRRKNLEEQNVNNKLLDCSDAHFYSSAQDPNRIGNVFSWLKADLTFQGLQRVIQCFDERTYICDIGDMPPKMTKVQENKTKYIRSISVHKKADSGLNEVWFDCDIPINPGMVAIIGNQGNGKSALTDIIALCGYTKTTEFSFLNKDKFRDKTNKAREFEATLTWEDGNQSKVSLDNDIQEDAFERVRYVPQRFFEAVTNETVVQEGGKFYGEIKKAIFSHIKESDKLGCYNFDALVALRTKQIQQTVTHLRQELSSINDKIVEIEQKCSPKVVQSLQKEIEAKQVEISNHQLAKPSEEEEPKESAEVNNRIEALRKQESELQEQIRQSNNNLSIQKQEREVLQQALAKVEFEKGRLITAISEIVQQVNRIGVPLDSTQLVTVSFDTSVIDHALEKKAEDIIALEEHLDPKQPNSLLTELGNLKNKREAIQTELDQTDKAYQSYRSRFSEWEEKRKKLDGSKDSVESLQWLNQKLLELKTNLPVELKELEIKRREKSKEIHRQLMLLVRVYQDITQPVQEHIQKTLLTREKYQIQFAIELVERDLADRLFSTIGQNTGTFGGVVEGRDNLISLIQDHNFSNEESALSFSDSLVERLKKNYKNSPPTPVDLQNLLKKGHALKELYDLIYDFSYLIPQYVMSLNGKPLKQLSPGERGILLLVFYLIIDIGDEPLLIDQPEGNLNNQSIYTNLVPVFKEAKNHRQIIVVTHNPNLAVVCDAEQIIHAQIDFLNKNSVTFDSGALENPLFNKLSLDVLEGTPPAFDARKITYKSR